MSDRVGIKIVIFTKDKSFIKPVSGKESALERISQRIYREITRSIDDYVSGESLYSPKTVDIDANDSITNDSRLDMLNNIQKRILKSSSQYIIEIYSNDPLFYFLEYGTGLFGPENKKIVAKDVGLHKKAFIFEIDGETIYARETKGMHPVPIMRSSLLKLKSDLKKIMPSMGLKYKSVNRDNREQLDIEIIGTTTNISKKGIIDGTSWMEKYGKRLMKL